jgi:hypothetical protein
MVQEFRGRQTDARRIKGNLAWGEVLALGERRQSRAYGNGGWLRGRFLIQEQSQLYELQDKIEGGWYS